MAEINKTEPNQFEQAGVNPFNSPMPGESMTVPKETRHSWESPPKHTTVEPVMEELFLNLTEKETYIELLCLDFSRSGICTGKFISYLET